jgi:hypothetical protein
LSYYVFIKNFCEQFRLGKTIEVNKMSLNDGTIIRGVSGITDAQRSTMLEFLKGAINSHCSKNPNEWFSIRDFLGGKHKDWRNNSFVALYNKWISKGKEHSEAVRRAGVDAGKLLKIVIKYREEEFPDFVTFLEAKS